MLARTQSSLPLAEGRIPLRFFFQASCLPLTWTWLWITSSVLPCVRRIPKAGEGQAGTTAVTHRVGRGTKLGLAAEKGCSWGARHRNCLN